MLHSLRLFLIIPLIAVAMTSAKEPVDRYTVATTKPFEDVVEDLKFAISEHNFKLTGQYRIGEAIAEREGIVFPRGRVFEFCNLQYAQILLESSPSYLLHMPCRIAVYERGRQIIVDARLLLENDQKNHRVITEVNRIIRAIVRYAAE